MSAIFGILNFDGAPVAARDIERMSRTLAHRGSAGARLWTGGAVALGHRLLDVTGEDRFDAQPLHDAEADATLVADLRLDNRAELAQAFGIAGAGLREMPDSALAMLAYKKWGEDCAGHLLGDFAFAIWDGRKRRLLLARDHMGQRCVFFHRGARSFVFASEIKGLWAHPDVPRVLSDAAIAKLLLHDLSPQAGQTRFDGIEGVTGATVMRVEANGAAKSVSYWTPHADPSHQGRGEDYYVQAYRDVLGEAVACRLRRATAPPGLLFSGGYDSSGIAALAGATLAEQQRKLVAVCSAMPQDYGGTIRHARRWAELCRRDMPHLDLHYVTREGANLLMGLEAAFATNEGAGSYHFVIGEMYRVLANARVRVVLDGYGGDQTLNPRGNAFLARLLLSGHVPRFAREFRAHRRMTGDSFWRTAKSRVVAPLVPSGLQGAWRRMARGAAPSWADKPIADGFAAAMIANGTINMRGTRAAKTAATDVHARMLYALNRKIANAGSTAAAAAHGLEPAHPFFDRRVVELALAIPADLHVKNGRNRYLACRALADLYPAEFQTRWRRNDDQVPDFQRMVKSVEPQILSEIARMERSENLLTRYIDFDKIRRLLAARGPDDHNSGWEQETQAAMTGFVAARFIEWFRRDNN